MKHERFQLQVEQTISRLLLEGRKEDAIKKHPNLKDEIEKLAATDPSKNLKYLQWQTKMISQGADTDDVIEIVKLFEKHKSAMLKNDINSFSFADFDFLKKELNDLENIKQSKKKQEEKIRCESKVVLDDDFCTVRQIMGKASAVHYGKGTRWCISMDDASHFESYSADNCVFFYVTLKNKLGDDRDKVALQFYRDHSNEIVDVEFWDAGDTPLQTSQMRIMWGDERIEKIFAVTRPIARAVKMSPIARVYNGRGSTEEISRVYAEELSVQGITDGGKKKLALKILESPETPIEIIDDIVLKGLSDNFNGGSRINFLMSALNVGHKLTERVINSILLSKFSYEDRSEVDELKTKIVSEYNVSNETLNGIIVAMLTDPEDIFEFQVASIEMCSNISHQTQMQIAQSMSTPLVRALINSDSSLEHDVIEFLTQFLIAKQSKFPAKSITTYSEILKKLFHNRSATNEIQKKILDVLGES